MFACSMCVLLLGCGLHAVPCGWCCVALPCPASLFCYGLCMCSSCSPFPQIPHSELTLTPLALIAVAHNTHTGHRPA